MNHHHHVTTFIYVLIYSIYLCTPFVLWSSRQTEKYGHAPHGVRNQE
jgi:hypothetical protein